MNDIVWETRYTATLRGFEAEPMEMWSGPQHYVVRHDTLATEAVGHYVNGRLSHVVFYSDDTPGGFGDRWEETIRVPGGPRCADGRTPHTQYMTAFDPPWTRHVVRHFLAQEGTAH